MNVTWVVLGAGILLLASRRFRPDFVVIAVAVALQLSGALTLEQALAGFSNPAVLTVAAFMILSYSARSLNWHQRWEAWLKRRGTSAGRLSFWCMCGAGLLSGILQEELAVGALLPSTIRAGRQRGVPPSKLMLPLAYGALIGRTTWLVGSSAALLMTWTMVSYGLAPFSILDFAGISLILLAFACLFVAWVGHTVLPWRRAETDPLDRFRIRHMLRVFVVRADSPLIGCSLGQVRWGQGGEAMVLGIKRTHEPILAPPAQLQLAHGDVLITQVDPNAVPALSREAGLEWVPGVELTQEDITQGDIELVEAVLRLDSSLKGQSLRQVDFRRRYGLSVLAIARASQVIVQGVSDVSLQGGDVLLIQGDRRRIDLMLPETKAIPLGERAAPHIIQEHSGWALGGIIAALGLAGLGWLSSLTSFLLLALVMSVLSRFPTRDAYRALDWPLLILLAGVIPWSTAMQTSGLSAALVEALLGVWDQPNPYLLLCLMYAVVVALVTVMNAPTIAVLLAPVAMGLAVKLGVNPQPFLMTTTLAASFVFLWPKGHRTDVLVQSTGGYTASDYARLGIWLVVLLGLLNLLIVPWLWPF
ncbi:MAG TPA: SLC13 family permease [Candidatus Bipolaricaulota bacterium]